MTSAIPPPDNQAVDSATAMASEIRALRDFAELSSDWFWEQDAEFRFTRFYGLSTEKLRRKQSDFIGVRRWDMPIHGIAAGQLAEHIATCERHEPFRNFEYEVPGDGGELQYYSVSGTPVLDEKRRVRRLSRCRPQCHQVAPCRTGDQGKRATLVADRGWKFDCDLCD